MSAIGNIVSLSHYLQSSPLVLASSAAQKEDLNNLGNALSTENLTAAKTLLATAQKSLDPSYGLSNEFTPNTLGVINNYLNNIGTDIKNGDAIGAQSTFNSLETLFNNINSIPLTTPYPALINESLLSAEIVPPLHITFNLPPPVIYDSSGVSNLPGQAQGLLLNAQA